MVVCLATQGPQYQLRCDYLVAADGASSSIRKQLGIAMIGDPALQHLVNIHFFSRDMARLLKQRPAMLYFVFSNQAIVVLVAHNLQEGEMVAQVTHAHHCVMRRVVSKHGSCGSGHRTSYCCSSKAFCH